MSANFIGYLIGYIIAIVGIGYALNAAGVGEQWILAVVLILIGLGIVYALSRSERDKAYRGSDRPARYREDRVEQTNRPDGPTSDRDASTRHTTTTRTYE